jgi:hypothetical protein
MNRKKNLKKGKVLMWWDFSKKEQEKGEKERTLLRKKECVNKIRIAYSNQK